MNDGHGARATSEIVPGSVDRTSKRAWLTAENAALALTALSGFLVFCGQGYYDRLFRDFAITPGMIEISNAQLISKGVECSFYALIILIKENVVMWAKSGLLGIAVAVFVVLLAWWIGGKAMILSMEATSNWLSRHTNRAAKWLIIALIASTGLIAGQNGGKLDAASIQRARRKAPNCFFVDGKLYRAIVLAQDRQRTILVHANRTSFVANDRMSYVSDCPRT